MYVCMYVSYISRARSKVCRKPKITEDHNKESDSGSPKCLVLNLFDLYPSMNSESNVSLFKWSYHTFSVLSVSLSLQESLQISLSLSLVVTFTFQPPTLSQPSLPGPVLNRLCQGKMKIKWFMLSPSPLVQSNEIPYFSRLDRWIGN